MTRPLLSLWCAWRSRVQLLKDGRADLLWYGLRTRLGRFDFSGVTLEELGLSPERSVKHANSGGPELRRVIRSLGITPVNRVLDLGCGKGGAILTLGQFPFAEIVGVELSSALIRIAETNAARAGLECVRFVHGDAADFVELDSFSHVYMYHPFPTAVMEAVMGNIARSLDRASRRLTLIYRNPECHEAISGTGLFRTERQFRFDKAPYHNGNNLVRIYVHEPASA